MEEREIITQEEIDDLINEGTFGMGAQEDESMEIDEHLGPKLKSFRVGAGEIINLEVPSYVTMLDVDYDCLFDNITVDKDNKNYREINNALYSKDGTRLIKGPRSATSFVVPPTTKVIDDHAFSRCSKLKTIDFPEGLEEIKFAAFNDCENLENLEFPSSLKSMATCFRDCHSLKNVYFKGNNLTNLGEDTFANCDSLETINLPSSIDSIKSFTFYNCPALKSIKIPSSVKEIGNSAFAHCISIETLDFPSSVKTIGEYAFENCQNLKQINIPDDGVTTIGQCAFQNCFRLDSITLPSSLKTLDEVAFGNCKTLKEVKINENLEKLYLNSFRECMSLKKLYIPKGVKNFIVRSNDELPDTEEEFQKYYFEEVNVSEENEVYSSYKGIVYNKDDNSLVYVPHKMSGRIEIKEGCEEIPDDAFENRTKITSVHLPKTYCSFFSKAFNDLVNLSEITIDNDNPLYMSDDGVVYLFDEKSLIFIPSNKTGNLAIDTDVNISSLEGMSSNYKIQTLSVGKDVTQLPLELISCFNDLEYIEVDDENNTYKSINGILYTKDETKLLFIPEKYKGYVNIPENMKEIDQDFMLGSYPYVEAFVVEETNKVFYTLFGILYSHKDKDFMLLPGLKGGSITIPKNYKKDDLYPHYDKTNKRCRRPIIFDKEKIEPEPINTLMESHRIFVLKNNKSKYDTKIKGDEKLASSYKSDVPEDAILFDSLLGYMENVDEINVEEGNKKYVSIDGMLYSKDKKTLLFCPRGKEGLVSVIDGVTKIKTGAFYNCTKITDIVLPSSVEEIGDFAFAKCESLKIICLPITLKRVSKGLFMYCSNLNLRALPNTVEYIDDYAFAFCKEMKGIFVPKELCVFNSEAFYGTNKDFVIYFDYDDKVRAVIHSKAYRSIYFKGTMGKLMSKYSDKYCCK